MNLVLVIGTRAELIKTYPVIQELAERDYKVKIISTGQHQLRETCQMLDIQEPDIVLTETVEQSSKFNGSKTKALIWNIKLLFKLRKTILDQRPDYVLYHGDTMSTTSAAVSSSRFMTPIRSFKTAHIESGLRSGSLREPFPEEISRIIADSLSNILFSVSEKSTQNLSKHKLLGKKVYNTGNTIVDSVKIAEEKEQEKEKYAVATVHRHENINSRKRMEKIIQILEQSPYNVKFYMHDNTRSLLKQHQLLERIKENSEIKIEGLKEYPDFLGILKDSELIYTDGGSIQEESLIFKIPCIVLRKRTERKEGLQTPLNFLSKLDPNKTKEFINQLEKIDKEIENPYGKPGVSQKILEKLEELQK